MPAERSGIEPDTKDWTWVLRRPCPECDFVAGAFDVTRTGVTLRENARAWAGLLGGDETALRRRPDPATWSVLEYACHVGDVFGVFDERLVRMLTEDNPTYTNWDQDAPPWRDATASRTRLRWPPACSGRPPSWPTGSTV